MRHKIQIDLLKLTGAQYENGWIMIPAEANAVRFYRHKDESLSADLTLFSNPRKERGKYGETHIVKRVNTQAESSARALGQQVDIPILGNIFELEEYGSY